MDLVGKRARTKRNTFVHKAAPDTIRVCSKSEEIDKIAEIQSKPSVNGLGRMSNQKATE